MKELFIAAHEELIEEYMIEHECDWNEAYEATADQIDERYRDKFADLVDAAKDRAKAEGNWPPSKYRAKAKGDA